MISEILEFFLRFHDYAIISICYPLWNPNHQILSETLEKSQINTNCYQSLSPCNAPQRVIIFMGLLTGSLLIAL